MKDFYEQFCALYPLKIKDWQTDNGSENLGEFDKTLQKAHIPHLFIYPRCPKINSIIERYNRTIQEEFIDNHLDIIHDKSLSMNSSHSICFSISPEEFISRSIR